MSSYPQIKHSWTLLYDNIAIKKLDKSSFLHHGTGIPKDFVPHFTLGEPVSSEATATTFFYNGAQYQARFQLDAENQRVRLFWKADFVDLLTKKFPYIYKAYAEDEEISLPPLMMLTLGNSQSFTVTFIDPASATKEWSDIEIEAAVIAYFNMLRNEQEGNQYSKAEMNRRLSSTLVINNYL
jgi:5-methylcytosine-specific restriction protein A